MGLRDVLQSAVSYTLGRYQGNDFDLAYASLHTVPQDVHQLLIDIKGTL